MCCPLMLRWRNRLCHYASLLSHLFTTSSVLQLMLYFNSILLQSFLLNHSSIRHGRLLVQNEEQKLFTKWIINIWKNFESFAFSSEEALLKVVLIWKHCWFWVVLFTLSDEGCEGSAGCLPAWCCLGMYGECSEPIFMKVFRLFTVMV